ncbi:MAG: hypothetical protein L6R48_24430, partial [Planctomycetes bacterium]|nr:hypothetical protein [Planctomycetota bacterium]
HRRLNDELYGRDQQRAVLELQESYEHDQRERELELLQRENRLKQVQLLNAELRQRVWLASGAVGVLLVALVGAMLHRLRQAGRLTPPGVQVHELAWLDDGTLAVRETEVLGEGERVVRRRADGTEIDEALFGGWDDGGVERDLRRTRDGALCGAGAAGGPLAAPRAELRPHAGPGPSPALRHGDLATLADGTAVAVGVRPDADGGQELVVVRLADGAVLARHRPSDAAPWSPCVHPGADEVAWIERAARSSRLMTARLPGLGQPAVRWQVDGVLAAPAFTPDGAAIAVCSDHTGVFNAWLVPAAGGAPRALTNSPGGVLACVPSPDGSRFAFIDHDRDGAYLGLLPAAGGAEPPQLDRAEPPVEPPPPPVEPPPPRRADGLADLRFLGVIPSTDAAGGGGQGLLGGSMGLGLRAHAGDPLRRLHLVAGLGIADGVAVGMARAESLHLAPLMLAAEVHRQAQAWDDAARLSGAREDYHERLTGGRIEAWAGPFLGLALGLDDHAPLADANGYPVSALSAPPPLVGSERYVEVGGAIDLRRERPLAIAPEDGVALSATFRHSGLGGDLERNRLVAGAEGTLATWRRAGHQLAARLAVGWSDGDDVLQGAFAVGGRTAASAAILRGYGHAVEATGSHLGGWSLAYRVPLWRPELGAGIQPLALRQVVAEGFLDAAKTSSDHPFGDGAWYRAAGLQLSLDAEVWVLRLAPGVALARQLDGDRRWGAEFVLGGSLGP